MGKGKQIEGEITSNKQPKKGQNTAGLPVPNHHRRPRDNIHRAHLALWLGHGRRYAKDTQRGEYPPYIHEVTNRHIAIQTLLPNPVPVHHLGLYREPTTLEPVEYYNNLPNHLDSGASSNEEPARLALILDPVIATGGTSAAAIQTLREWGAHRIVVLAVLGATAGVLRAAAEWPEGVDIWIAGVDDAELTPEGMLQPGLGDVGDRLFLTIGK